MRGQHIWWMPLTAALFVGACTNTPKIAFLDYVKEREDMSKFVLANTSGDFTLVMLPMHIGGLVVPDYSIEVLNDGLWERIDDWHPANPRGHVLDEFDVNECFILGPHKTCEFSIPTPDLTNEWRIVVSYEAYSDRGFWGRLFTGQSKVEFFGTAISQSIKGFSAASASERMSRNLTPERQVLTNAEHSILYK